MVKLKKVIAIALTLASILPLPGLFSCSPGGATAGPPGDSKITGEAKAVHQYTSGYPYDVDFIVLTSEDVDTLPNPTKESIGAEITAQTNEDIQGLDPGEKFTANVKWAINASKPVPIFYIYNVKEVH